MKDRRSRKLTLAVSQFKKTGELTPYLQKRMKGNIQLVWELFPGLAPTPDALDQVIKWSWQTVNLKNFARNGNITLP